MYVFYSEEKRGNKLILSEQEAKHFKVRRIKRNETFGVIYNEKLYECKIIREEKNKIICEIVGEKEIYRPPKAVTLYQCVTQELKTMDQIIKQATELGVTKLVPVISERSFRNEKAINKRIEKWKRLVIEAMKQSRRPFIMEISSPIELKDLEANAEENLLLDNFYRGLSVKDINFKAKSFSVIVGPEGGFSEKEGKLLRGKGFKSILLEPYTLRTETACVAILSILMNC
ncbi:RsmE family RNA methyltransferase [Aquifex sp.]